MSVILNINGNDYFYPETGDLNWGADATDWAQAVTTGMLQKAGGLFLLLNEVDFGPNHGLKSVYYKSASTNSASTGTLRLSSTDGIYFRNATNTADLGLTVNSLNELLFNGVPVSSAFSSIGDTNSIDLTVTSGTLTADLNLSAFGPSLTYQPVVLTVLADGLHAQISNASILSAIPNASSSTTGLLTSGDWNTFNNKQNALGFTPENVANKATDLLLPDNTKYPSTLAVSTALGTKQDTITGGASSITTADLTASKALVSDALGKVSASSITSTELSYLSGVTSSIQIQLNAKQDALPSQTGNNGKFLSTDGSVLSWQSVPAPSGSLAFAFGSGSDGNVTVTTAITLTRDMYYNNLTVSGSGSINAAGYRIFVKNTLDLTGASAFAIHRVGTAGSNASGATGGAGGAEPTGTANVSVGPNRSSSRAGGNGSTTTGSAGVGGSGVINAATGWAAPTGGNGGAGSSGAGGLPGTHTFGTIKDVPQYYTPQPLSILLGVMNGAGSSSNGGGGGGGDSTNSGGGAGGAGANASVLYIAAKNILSSGAAQNAISAIGRLGGNGANATTGNCGGGGGGQGGSGGYIYLVYETKGDAAATDLIDASGANGGSGGNGTGTGKGGAGGAGGGSGVIFVMNLTTGSTTYSFGTIGSAATIPITTTGSAGGAGSSLKLSL